MLKKILPLMLLFLAHLILAQTSDDPFRKASLFVDQCGKISDNYIDPDYSPLDPIEMTFSVGTSFLPGKIYLKDGKILNGLVKYSMNGRKLVYKPRKSDIGGNKRLKAEDCLGFTIQQDTFTVIQNFDVIKKRGEFSMNDNIKLISFKKPEFAEVLGEENDCSICKFVDIKSNGQQVNIYYLLHKPNDNIIKDVSDNNPEWKKDISPLYSSTNRINKPEDAEIREYFRKRSFEDKRKAGHPLLFTHYMVETEDKDAAKYRANIGRKMYWQLSFSSMEGLSVMEHCYKNILPYEKSETSTYYFPNGNVRKIVVNEEGREIAERRFYSNGNLHYDIVQQVAEKKQSVIDWYKKWISKDDDEWSKAELAGAIRRNFSQPEDDKEMTTYYLTVCDSLGNNLLDDNGNGEETIYDEVRKRKCYLKFRAYQLKEVFYRNNDGGKVYQYCDRPLKINGFNDFNLKQQILSMDWKSFPQGTVLARFVVDEEGQLKELNALNAIDTKLDAVINGFLHINKSSFSYRIAKHNETKVMAEVIVPIYIGVSGYGPTPSANNGMWMMQQQQMQMMQMNSFRAPVGF
ncbi:MULTISPECIES: hypothetical protein [unclassified Carboxylicivirga]|uniref:hypothetical protein n=1 Tax=Carboxylicivirga TaxID=1628153 RepID=UPI003D348488